MKNLFFLSLLCSCVLNAQSSFRIFDVQHNDITGGVVYISDTNATSMQMRMIVENVDTGTYQVTAGRMVISQPVNAVNAITWGPVMYVPSLDTSVVAVTLAPGDTAVFIGDYFPDTATGVATINYCVWQRTDMNNSACVTTTFSNLRLTGIENYSMGAPVAVYPNPALNEINISWSGWQYSSVKLYASTGELVSTRNINNENQCSFDLSNLASGIYLISCTDVRGYVYNTRIVH